MSLHKYLSMDFLIFECMREFENLLDVTENAGKLTVKFFEVSNT